MTEVFVIDDQHPEDLAMLQALYSRSPASVVEHLEKLKASGSGKFMESYYVGYGHASIGDCGTTTLFVEQVSMMVAKAIQDHPLYNGQEASTRYLDFSKQEIVDPYNHPESRKILDRWMELYNRTLPKLIDGLKKRYPFDPDEYKNEKIWSNTLAARAFDIARSLLPIGTTTLLSWTTSLRAARDHLRRLKHHPLPEVRDTAQKIFAELIKKYPHSFNAKDIETDADARDAYAARFASRNHFASLDDLTKQFRISSEEQHSLKDGEIVVRSENIDVRTMRKVEAEALAARPKGAHLPWRMEAYGRYNYLFLLDFGSFRDIHRHRNGVCQVPLIDGWYGFNPWYLGQFSEHLESKEAAALIQNIDAQFSAINDLYQKGLEPTPLLNQYLYPMGTQALIHASYSVPETIYVGEIRSAKTVHPSLRPIAQKMLNVLKRDLPGIALYGDMETDSWSAKRGEQTITSKDS